MERSRSPHRLPLLAIFALLFSLCLPAWGSPRSVDVEVKARTGLREISPYIYGRNISDVGDLSMESDSAEDAAVARMVEAGIRMLRANGGNNSTRYNWRRKLTVHPDWYNNVYAHDWDVLARKVQERMPGVDAMLGFQLTGYAAKTNEFNFGDWAWKQAHGFNAERSLDLAGGGSVEDDGTTLVQAGNASLYNEPWPADSTVGIVPHWKDELGYDMSRFRHWSMDNEPEIWRGTHSDLDLPVTGDFIVERYVEVAKKARAAWPEIKLGGPVVANEWQWCSIGSYNDQNRPVGPDRSYCWLEYFIMKVAAAQRESGVRLLDLFDIHWYPTETSYEDRTNWHRVLFDTNYVYPGANGIKNVGGSWNSSVNREYIFKRISDWLDQYFGEGHGIGLGMTETDLIAGDAMTTALTYASFLGTMQDNGVQVFTPWTWGDGMYEVVHLFSRYGKRLRVESVSADDSLLSAYASVNAAGGDSLVVILVNRSASDTLKAAVRVEQFDIPNEDATTLTLSGLAGETFVSHAQNALRTSGVTLRAGRFELAMPPKTITAVLLSSYSGVASERVARAGGLELFARGRELVARGVPSGSRWTLFDLFGRPVAEGTWNGASGSELRVTVPSAGRYIFRAGGEVRSVGAI